MTGTYVLLGVTFIVTSSFIVSICVYTIIMVAKLYKKRTKTRRQNFADINFDKNKEINETGKDLPRRKTSGSLVLSEEALVNHNPKCNEFCGVCCCLIFEDLPHCFEMCFTATLGSCPGRSCTLSCCHMSLQITVKTLASFSLTIAILALILYISSAMESMNTVVLPLFTILHLFSITLLIIGALNQKRVYLLPWMIISWISWLSLMPCVFGSPRGMDTTAWVSAFKLKWVIVSVVLYFGINLVVWFKVKQLYGALIEKSKENVRNKNGTSAQQNRIENNYEIDLPQIVVYGTEENDCVDGSAKTSSSNEDHPMLPILESDLVNHSETTSSSNNKMKVAADVVVAGMALQHKNYSTLSNRPNSAEETSHHLKQQLGKSESSKKGSNPEQRVPGMIHVPGSPKLNLSSHSPQRHHHGIKERHVGKNVDGKRQNTRQAKGMRAGARIGAGATSHFDGIGSSTTSNNNNYGASDSKEGELFDFLVDVGGILEDQYNEEQETSPSRSIDDGSGDGSRKTRKQRGGSFSTFLIIADTEESDRKPEKKSDLHGNRKMGIQSKSASNLTSTGYQANYMSDIQARKKELKPTSSSSSSSRPKKKNSSCQRTKTSVARSRR